MPYPKYDRAIKEILAELDSQDEKWGANRDHQMYLWNTILSEEVGELARAILEEPTGFGKNIREEATQVAAVAIRILCQEEINNDRTAAHLTLLDKQRT